MTEVYNIRIGDMIWNQLEGANIIGLVYKMTPKYVYYAVCARHRDTPGDHFVTKDNRVKKDSIYKAIREGSCFISYSSGTKRRRKIEDFS